MEKYFTECIYTYGKGADLQVLCCYLCFTVEVPYIFTGGPGPIFSLPMDGLGPGSYTYNITAFSPDGQRSTSVIAFAVPGITRLCACLLSNLNLQLSYRKSTFHAGSGSRVSLYEPPFHAVSSYTKYLNVLSGAIQLLSQ